jgi:hypothetical protein
MNFGASKLKVIFSLIVFIILEFLFAFIAICLDGCPPWYFHTLEPIVLILSFVGFLVVYSIWSLIEKK